jgi:hypothetical protein
VKKLHFTFLLLVLIPFCSFGQDGFLPLDSNKKIIYSDVAAVEKSREALFQNAQKWVVKTFGNYENAVIQEDKQSGKLVLKSYSPVSTASFEYLRFTMTIDCQDNKYQVVINDVEGISKSQTVTALGTKQNDEVVEKSILLKTESNRKKKSATEELLNHTKTDNDQINNAMYSLLASLKLSMSAEGDI